MLDGSLAASVRRIETRECSQQGSHDGDNFPTVSDMCRGLFEDEEGSLRIDSIRVNRILPF